MAHESQGDVLFKRERPNLDNIPEDVIRHLIETIQTWTELRASDNFLQRESAIEARDDALNNAAHACSQSWQIWNQYALRNSTLDMYDLWNGRHLFLTGLERSKDAGSRIKTIRFEVRRSRTQQQIRLIDFAQLSNLPISVRKKAREKDGRLKAVQMFYEKLVNLEELIILHPSFILPSFVQKVDGKSVPLLFLSHSLKRLYISKFERGTIRAPLTAKNVAWLLLFCQNLFEAAFGGLEFSLEDCRFLLDHSQAYEGLSKIKRLALSIEFVFDQSKMSTWWGLGLTSISGYELSKNNGVIHLLRMTGQLTSLEVFFNDAARNPRDETYLSSDFTSSLHSSFSSLKHLRLGGIQCNPDNPSSTDYSKFTALTIMTVDHLVLHNLENSSVKPPTTLTTFILPFYCFFPEEKSFRHFIEDAYLAAILNLNLPNLCQIVLPSKPLIGGFEYAPMPFKAEWMCRRNVLKEEITKTSGKVSLREIEPGELIGDLANGECFMSSIRWLSP